jgi:hypothetical protein
MLAVILAGCGQTGAPLPPTLALPEPVADLSAARVANHVTLSWTMPKRTTDSLLLQGPQPVSVCRKLGSSPCVDVADLHFPPEKPATYDDALPADLTTGDARLLTYTIEVKSRHGRSAGASNPAWSAAGSPPPAPAGLRGAVEANGVLLTWQPVTLTGEDSKVHIQRTLLSVPAKVTESNKPGETNKMEQAFGPAAASRLVQQQALVVRMPGSRDTGKALDPDAAFDQRYQYRVSRVAGYTLDGRAVTVEGPASDEITVETKDIFPPQPPSGLTAVAASEEGAIDLSWTPNAEQDLAGYAVYRSDSGQKPVRISGVKPLDAPAFHDAAVSPGRAYTYSVTAIDRDGNESAPSAETNETLPPKP